MSWRQWRPVRYCYAVRGAVKGFFLYFSSPAYRAYCVELQNCPECAPLAGMMCAEHQETGMEFI